MRRRHASVQGLELVQCSVVPRARCRPARRAEELANDSVCKVGLQPAAVRELLQQKRGADVSQQVDVARGWKLPTLDSPPQNVSQPLATGIDEPSIERRCEVWVANAL